ncbi:ribbon-helix-helix protein, CopG family [Mesorhizobium sp. Cs1321R2N1]
MNSISRHDAMRRAIRLWLGRR